MALDDILIKIRTTFEGKGAQDASKSLDALDQSSRRAAPSLDKAAGASKFSAEEFTRAARSASVLNGSMEGLGALAHQVASRFSGLGNILVTGGGVIAAFTAWKAAITAVIDAMKAQAASLRDITAANERGNVLKMVEAFDRLQDSISKAAEEQKRFVAGQQAMADARKNLAMANIDADEQEALAKESNPLKRDVIKARFAEQRTGVSATSDIETESRKADALDRQIVNAGLSQGVAKEQADALAESLASVLKRDQKAAAQQRKDMDFYSWWSPGIGEKLAGYAWQGERDQNLKDAQAINAKLLEAKKKESAAHAEGEDAQTMLDAQMVNVQAIRRRASTTVTAAAAGTTTATTAVSVADLAAQRAAAEAQLPQYQQQASTAQEYLSTIPDRIASGTYSQADQAAMQRALAAAEEQTALLQSFISRIGQEMSKQNEILRTLPSSR